jgi:hypothetical protein
VIRYPVVGITKVVVDGVARYPVIALPAIRKSFAAQQAARDPTE